MGQPRGQEAAANASVAAEERSKKDQAIQEQILAQIRPFATSLMSLGIDPKQFMNSPLGQAILGQQRQGISQEFQGARNNLMENLGSSGLVGSGVGLGPLANLYGMEAQANSNIFNQMPLTGLNIGMQGAGLLSGQQRIFDPNPGSGQAIGGFNNLQQGGFGYQFANAFGSHLGGGLGSAMGSGAAFGLPQG